MYGKKTILTFLLLTILLTALSSLSLAENTEYNNGSDLLRLKAGYIHTDTAENEKTNFTDSSLRTESVEEVRNYYIVQFTGPVRESWKENITASGATIYGYVPDNAFIFEMNEELKNKIQTYDFVRWAGEYKASYKYEPESAEGNGIGLSGISGTENKTYKVLLFSEERSSITLKKIELLGGKVLSCSGNIMKISVPPEKIPDIAAIEGISWIEEYIQPQLSNDVASTIVNACTVHENYGLNGSGQIIAVCDSGLDTGNPDTLHPDLRGRLLAIFDVASDGSVADQNGHGTHVSGSVLGNGSASAGQYAGMAPEALLVFQAAGDSSTSIHLPDNLSVVFQQAYDQGARIHTNSWGGSAYGEYTTESRQVDQFMWEHPDMLILFAAGNKGVDLDANGIIDRNSIDEPATAKNCIAVGASESYRPNVTSLVYGDSPAYYPVNPIASDGLADNDTGIAAFSSRGPTDDGRIKPDLVAPGTFIASTRSSLASGSGWGIIDDNYLYMGGTSMATPITAGSAALVREYYTDIENVSNPSAALLKATLINGACNLTPGQYGEGTYQEINGRPDYSQGWGRVDVENSIFPEYPESILYYDKIPLETGESWDMSFDVAEGSGDFRVTLVWTDYPGNIAAQVQLVNNLDLTVSGPDGTYYGNSGTSTSRDSINNVEGVELLNPSGGTYTVTVKGTNVPQGPQNFSLVISFTADVNEFPANNSYTNNNFTSVSVDITDPHGIKENSINMSIDGVPVNCSITSVTGGFTVLNNTLNPYSEGKHNVSVTAVTNFNQEVGFAWIFYEDYEAPVLSDLTNSSTSSSVTLAWNQSEDTDHVEVWIDGDFLINNSDSDITDTGLSPSTSYNYSLRPVDMAGNTGTWTNTTVTTSAASSSSSSSSSSGGGGGGGGSTSGEANGNIQFKDVITAYANKGELVGFEFDKADNDIDYISYTSLKNAGKISVTIEILKDKSGFAGSPAPGVIYRNINIWVGKTGYATGSNIQDPVIGFRVSREWLDDNNIDPSGITLYRYSDDAWSALPTAQTDSDDEYVYFKSDTPGFSPFAISAEKTSTVSSQETEYPQVNAGSAMNENSSLETAAYTDDKDTGQSVLPVLLVSVMLAIIALSYVLLRRQQN